MARQTHIDTEVRPYLSRGPLVFDPAMRVLTGPAGSKVVTASEAAVLEPLMREIMVSSSDLDTQGLAKPEHAVRMRVARVARSLVEVGIARDVLRNIVGLGWYLALRGELPTRTFTGSGLELLERLLATHPDRAAVARLCQ